METQGRTPDRRRRRRGRALVGLAMSMAMVFASMAPVEAAPKTTISGNATLSDCGGGGLQLTGDLQGCLNFFPARFECEAMNGFDRYREWGREIFTGRYMGERGKFRTKYFIEATYLAGTCAAAEAGEFNFNAQLTGGCDHYINGRRGVFKGKRGMITFFDVIPEPGVSGASNFYYAGYLR